MAHIKPVIATSQTSSGQDDTMQGIAEIASSQSTLSSAETPTPSTENSSDKNSNSGPSTTPFGADNNNEKPKSRTTSSFKKNAENSGSENENLVEEDSQGGDEEDGPKAAAFGDEQNGDDSNNRKAGFHRDEHFQRRLDFFKDKEHPWIFDREYTYQHEEGPNAGEKVDLAYFNAHQKFLEKKRAMNSAKGGGFEDVTKIGENSGASSEADVPSCGSDTEEDETDKEDAGEMGAPPKSAFSGEEKKEDEDSSDQKSEEAEAKSEKKNGGFGNEDGSDGSSEKLTDAEMNIFNRLMDNNRLYSGHICHALEDNEELHKNNDLGEELEKIESLHFQVTQAVKDEVEIIAPEKYLCNSFDDLTQLNEKLKTNLSVYGWEKPLLVQRVSMRPIQEQQDILVNAQTGSGKTGAFLIPIINHILTNKREKKFPNEDESGIPGVDVIGIDPRALIMTPTRELAIQIAKEAIKLTRGLEREEIKICNLYGGTKRSTQRFHAFGADIIVGTPGRVADILFPSVEGVTKQHFESCEFVVLDEADRMLDNGFGELNNIIINKIKEKRSSTGPVSKVLTSATFPAEVQVFANKFLRPDYLYAQCGILNAPCASVKQQVIKVEGLNNKFEQLRSVLEEFQIGSGKKALVFANTKTRVDYLGCMLSESMEFTCMTMHGDRSQEQREFALWTFATTNCHVLIATNVAARGLDIPAVDLIVNFDCSDIEYFHDDFIHRIGRTGRVGRPGTAVTFIQEGGRFSDEKKVPILVKLMKDVKAEVPEWLQEMAENTPDSDEEEKSNDAASVTSRISSKAASSKSCPTLIGESDDEDENEEDDSPEAQEKFRLALGGFDES